MSTRVVSEIGFDRPVRVVGSSLRQADFFAADGWLIELHDFGVTLSKPASQNVAEVSAFTISGVGYGAPGRPRIALDDMPAMMLTEEQRRASGAAAAAASSSSGSARESGDVSESVSTKIDAPPTDAPQVLASAYGPTVTKHGRRR